MSGIAGRKAVPSDNAEVSVLYVRPVGRDCFNPCDHLCVAILFGVVPCKRKGLINEHERIWSDLPVPCGLGMCLWAYSVDHAGKERR